MQTRTADRKTSAPLPYESPALRAVTGPAIRPGGLELTRRAAARCGLRPGDRVLDVGCGTGATAAFLRRHLAVRAAGLDPSATLLAAAAGQNPGLPLVRAAAQALPLRNGCLAAVFCECVLSLVAAPRRALEEFHRVLRAEGRLVVGDLYRRDGGTRAPDAEEPCGGCPGGAVGRETVLARLDAAGFAPCLWEDHSVRLRELAARLVWYGVPLPGARAGGCGAAPADALCRPGYFLLIARKRGTANG